jgi:hypothetical protein
MITISVKGDVLPIVNDLNSISKGLGDRALVSSLNKTIAKAKTEMSSRIRDEYNISAAAIREKLVVEKASRSGDRYAAILSGNPLGSRRRGLNVIRFLNVGATQSATRRGSNNLQAELRFKIKKAGGLKGIKGAFILNVPGHPVMRRKRSGDRGIEGVVTIGVPQMFQAKKVQIPVRRSIGQNFERIFNSDVRYFLSTIK